MTEPDPRFLVARGHRRTRDWTPVAHGLYRRSGVPEPGLSDLAAWQYLFTDDGCFTALTSAAVRGWWMPPLPHDVPVFISLAHHDPRPMRAGVTCSRHRTPVPYEWVQGLPLATVPETLLACARWLSLLDLVVLVDCALHNGETTVEELLGVARPRRPGTRALRRTLRWADGRSESPWETLLRIFHALVGVAVEPQVELHDDGVFVGRLDLWLVGTSTYHEYDGGGHRTIEVHRHDLRRDRAVVRAGAVRRGFTSDDLLHRAVSVLRDIDLAVGRPHDSSRVQEWQSELSRSLLTPAGQRLFRQRLGLSRAA